MKLSCCFRLLAAGLFLCLGWASTAQAIIPASERAVLTDLYASTNGASWTTNTNWNGAVGTECSWAGITCDATESQVIAIWLEFNKLTGTLPSLSGLTALQAFVVRNNQLTGSIPSLSELTALQLFNVSSNQLTGSIPSLSGLTALQQFVAYSNQLTGSIPSLSGLTSLQYFYVYNNQLTGSIPPISDLAALQNIYASNNQLSGPVPAVPISMVAGFSDLCGNNLVSSGSTVIDAAWDAAQGSSWLACQTVAVPPTCALTASPASISTGGTSTLTASCSPAATSYTWTGGTCAGSGASCMVTPSATTTYTVSGINATGTGTAASATVTVTTPVPAPSCTMTASPPAILAGNPSTLTASCSPAADSYVWSSGACSSSAATCVVTPSATFTYTVSGVNTSGTGTAASATVTVTTPVPAPSCTMTASPASISAGGTSTLTANCSPAATSYVWSDSTCSSNTATCTVTPSATTTYTVTGSNAAGSSILSSAIVTVNSVAAAQYSGLWWNPNESGWGMSITQHGSMIFAVPFTYDSDGQPIWYVMSSCPILTAGSCTGDLYEVTGGSSPAKSWDDEDIEINSMGSGTLTFDDANHGRFDYILNGVSGSKPIERQLFSSGTAQFAVDYTDLWWNPDESGWGIALTQDHGMIFAAWFTYDKEHDPVWYVASACPLSTNSLLRNGCTGDLYKVTGGSPLTDDWNGSNIDQAINGSVTFTFSDDNNGLMSYTLNGVANTRVITRQGF